MKKFLSLMLAFMLLANLCVINASAITELTFMSIYSKRAGYAGAWYDPPGSGQLYIAATNVKAFENYRETLRKNEKYADGLKALDSIIFVEAKYTEAEMTEIIRKIWADDEFRVEHSGTQARCVINIGLVNPPDNAEATLRERYKYDKITVEAIYREYVQPGDAWSRAAAKTAGRVRADKYTGWLTNKNTGKRYYFKDGVRLTGAQTLGSTLYVFDSGGMLTGRRNLKAHGAVRFDGDVKMKDGKIEFEIHFDLAEVKNPWDIFGNPHFELFVYMDGKWERIPYNYSEFTDEAFGHEEGVATLTKSFSDFSCEFAPGLYRVRTSYYDGGEPGNRVKKTAVGEFNIV